MLATHGIDLRNHIILDTFELSEIFSQDAESLNLGFLGKKYQIPQESEHRALDDTKLSIELFCRYL
jgi:DNA polymerase III alpha subunit (gram-positive type)